MKFLIVCLLLSVVLVGNALPAVKESGKISPEIICRQAFIIGECSPTTTFWSYDPSKGICRESCGNNENKFTTKEKCEYACSGIFDGPESNDSEEIKIKAFERVNDPIALEPDLLM